MTINVDKNDVNSVVNDPKFMARRINDNLSSFYMAFGISKLFIADDGLMDLVIEAANNEPSIASSKLRDLMEHIKDDPNVNIVYGDDCDLEFIRMSETYTFDHLNYLASAGWAETRRQEMIKYLNDLDMNNKAIVKVIGMISVCDKEYLNS